MKSSFLKRYRLSLFDRIHSHLSDVEPGMSSSPDELLVRSTRPEILEMEHARLVVGSTD